MALAPGARLGPYEIHSALGAGGMGEVYRARDSRLDRDVAIKVLPEALASDPQFRERFDREARTLATLSHQHICQVFDVGRHEKTDFLVMEFLEGETLAERLRRPEGLRLPAEGAGIVPGEGSGRPSGLPIEQALAIGIQIADALTTAHRAGIVHRDLKPANIFLVGKRGLSTDARRGGLPVAKLLDFGLAKTTAAAGAGAGLSALPTRPPGLTQQGTILGTFQYMAPEQVEGQEADARSDLFAFGCVLYEMVTGRRAFEGKTAASVMAAILEREPPGMHSLQPLTPALLDHLVSRCLAKNPEERWQTASDVLQELKWLATAASQPTDTASAPPVGRSRMARGAVIGVAAGVVVSVLAASLFWMLWSPVAQTPRPVARLTVDLPSSVRQAGYSVIAVARDGRTFLYSALGADGIPRLYTRRLAQLESMPIRGTENAQNAALSPDATWVAFVAGGQLKKVALTGGPPVVLCDVPEEVLGTDWSTEDSIVFGGPEGLSRVPAAGGMPEVIVKADPGKKEAGYRWPYALADGRTILFTIWFGANTTAQVAIASLDTGERRTLAQGSYPRVTPTGQLLFTRARSLWAVRLDESRLATIGEPVPVLEDLQTMTDGRSMFDIAADGTFAYRPAGVAGGQRLVWFDREGRTTPAVDEQLTGIYHAPPRLSPSGRLLAVTIHPEGGEDQVVLYNLERGIRTPIGTGPRMDSRYPVWTPDGSRITFASTSAGTLDLYSVPEAGGAPEPLLVRELDQRPMSWSPDGRVLAFSQLGRPAGDDIWMLPRGGEPMPFIVTPFDERNAAFSPDGRWLAYESNESGRFEVYVQPYPGPGERVRISTSGGRAPVWARKGAELFYWEEDRDLMVVSIGNGSALRVGAPMPLAQVQLASGERDTFYDVSPDGRRFVAIEDANATPPSLIVVQNWLEELQRLVPR